MPATTHYTVNLPTDGADQGVWGAENNAAHEAWDGLIFAIASVLDPAWVAFTPTVTADSGTFTTTASGKYKQIGKTVWFDMFITITATGTAAGAIVCTLPVTMLGGTRAVASTINVNNGQVLFGDIVTNTLRLTEEGFAYPGYNGAVFSASGTYEAA